MRKQIPMVGHLDLDGARPQLVANQCAGCDALYFDRRNACCAVHVLEKAAV